MDFKHYLKAVGTGPKGNRALSFDESKEMMQQILSTTASPEQIAAFLIAWRLKPETIEEFCGALNTLDDYATHYEVENSIELGYPFDGKAKTPYLLPLISKALLKNDLNLVVLGDKLQPAKTGKTIQDLLNSIVKEKNLYYFNRKEYCPALHNLTDLRNLLGLRTAFNTLEKLPNITKSQFAITGVHHKPYVKKYLEIFANRYERFALIQGSEGTPELFKKGTLWTCESGTLNEQIIDPATFGINNTQDLKKLAQLNAAVLLFVAKKASTIEEAYESLEKTV